MINWDAVKALLWKLYSPIFWLRHDIVMEWKHRATSRHLLLTKGIVPIKVAEYKHGFFIDDTAYKMIYRDWRGRYWVRAWGTIKPTQETEFCYRHETVKALGGMGWEHIGNRVFACEYAVDGPNPKHW